VNITEDMNIDLEWWRTCLILGKDQPAFLGASIRNIRTNYRPDYHMATDASSLIGGVRFGLNRDHLFGADSPFTVIAIRWTRVEFEMFARCNISINILEYFAFIFFIILYAPILRGKIIDTEIDNMAALSWISKERSSIPWADDLSRIFILVCMLYDIRIIASHIKGTNNTIPDFRSRDLETFPQDLDEAVMSANTTNSQPSSRLTICRSLLYNIVNKPSRLSGQELLQHVMRLTSGPGSTL